MPNSCFCCCGNKSKYLEEKKEKFGEDVINEYMFAIDFGFKRSKGELKSSFSFFDQSPEGRDFFKRYMAFRKEMKEDEKNFCKHEIGIGATEGKAYKFV